MRRRINECLSEYTASLSFWIFLFAFLLFYEWFNLGTLNFSHIFAKNSMPMILFSQIKQALFLDASFLKCKRIHDLTVIICLAVIVLIFTKITWCQFCDL